MAFSDDVRKQVRLQVGTDGVELVDKLVVALTDAQSKLSQLQNEIVAGQRDASEASKEWRSLATEISFFSKALDEAVENRDTAFSEAAIKEAERQAKLLADYERDQAKRDALAESAAIKEAERQAKLLADYERDQGKRDALAESTAIKEAERQAKLLADYERDQARKDAAAEAAAIEEAERQAKLLADYEQDQARRDAAAEATAIEEAERRAKLLADYEQDQARRDAAAEAAAIKEVERQAKILSDYEEWATRHEQLEAEERERREEDFRQTIEFASRLEESERLRVERRRRTKDADVFMGMEADRMSRQLEALRSLTEAETEFNGVVNQGAVYARAHNETLLGFSTETTNAARAQKGLSNSFRDADEPRQIFGKGLLDLVFAQKAVAREGEDASEVQKRFGYSILHVAHALQDAQYGVGAVLNNIPLLVQAFGGGPGLAGTVMVSAVAIDTLYNNFDRLKAAFSDSGVTGFTTDVERQKQKVEELEGAWLKLPPAIQAAKQARIDLARLEDEEKIRAMPDETEIGNKEAFGKMVKATPGGGRGLGSIVHDVVTRRFLENTSGAIRAALESGRMQPLDASGATPQQVVERMGEDDEFARFARQRYLEEVIPVLKADLQSRLKEGEKDTTNAFLAEVNRHPRVGARDDAGDLVHPGLRAFEENLPQALKKKAADKLWGEEAERQVSEWERDEEHAAAKDKRLGDQLTDLGAQRQIEGQQSRQRERQQDVGRAASSFLSEMPKGLPDSLDTAVARRLASGQAAGEIAGAIVPQVKQRLEAAGVAKDLIGEVADSITDSILTRVRTGAAVRSRKAPEGAAEIVREAEEKAAQAAQRGEGRGQRQARAMTREQVARGMQQAYGLTPGQAEDVAPEVMRGMERGMSPMAAGRAAVAKLQGYMSEQQRVILEMQSHMEQMLNIMGPATAALGMMDANNKALSAKINQAGRGASAGMWPAMMPR